MYRKSAVQCKQLFSSDKKDPFVTWSKYC